MEFGHIPMSPMLVDSLNRAYDVAMTSGAGELALEHLLYALCDDADAIGVLDSSRVDIARLKIETAAYLSAGPAAAPPAYGELSISADASRILEAAAAAARGGRRRDINGAVVLAAIVGDGQSAAAQLLQAQGLTFDEAIRALQSPPTAPPVREAPFSMPPTEDVLARARERVLSRSQPTLRQMTGEPARPPRPPATPQEIEAALEAAPPMSRPGLSPAVDAFEQRDKSSEAAEALEASEPQEPLDVITQGDAVHASEADLAEAVMAAGAPHQLEFEPAAPQPYQSPLPGHVAPAWPPPDAQSYAPPPTYPPYAPYQAESAPPPEPMTFEIPRPVPIQPPPIPMAPPPSYAAPVGADFGEAQPQPPWPQYDPFSLPSGRADPGFGAATPGGFPARPPEFEINSGGGFGYSLPPQAPPSFPNPAPAGSGQNARASAPLPSLAADAPSPRRRERAARTEIGQLAENIPRTMRVGNTERVELRIAKAAVKAVAEGLEGGGAAWRHDIVITKAMAVRLRAPEGGFFIETASPETQWIENQLGLASDDFASWRFLVTPQTRGRARLQIIISARTIGTDGVAAETALPDQVIDVKVRTNYRRLLGRALGWIMAAIAGGTLAQFGETGFEAARPVIEKFIH